MLKFIITDIKKWCSYSDTTCYIHPPPPPKKKKLNNNKYQKEKTSIMCFSKIFRDSLFEFSSNSEDLTMLQSSS